MNKSQLMVKAEFFLQSIVRYGSAARCPYCDSADADLIARKFLVVRIVRCANCGLVFSRPVYRTWLSANFYDRLYSAEGSTTKLPSDAELSQMIVNGFAGTDKHASAQLAALTRIAPAGKRMLELGSSWGYFLAQARAVGWDVTGVEIGATRREFAIRKLGVRSVARFEELASDEVFDVIYSSHV